MAELRSLDRELGELRATERERARELDLLEFSLAEIAGIDPQPDEDVAAGGRGRAARERR